MYGQAAAPDDVLGQESFEQRSGADEMMNRRAHGLQAVCVMLVWLVCAGNHLPFMYKTAKNHASAVETAST